MSDVEKITQPLPSLTPPICTLVQDLLPLYLDQEVSPESHAVIAEHLAQCERCSGYLAGARSMRAQILRDQQAMQAVTSTQPALALVQRPWVMTLVGVLGALVCAGVTWVGIILLVTSFYISDQLWGVVLLCVGLAGLVWIAQRSRWLWGPVLQPLKLLVLGGVALAVLVVLDNARLALGVLVLAVCIAIVQWLLRRRTSRKQP
jgi:hypothetical protein